MSAAPARKKGTIVIISAPSRGGKDVVIRGLLKHKNLKLRPVIGYTTRPKRDYEINGVHYNFVTPAKFKQMIRARAFAEWAMVNGYYYGTSLKDLAQRLAKGERALLKIEVKGALQVIKKFPGQTLSIFLKPGSIAELAKRFTGDHNFPPAQVRRRLARAKAEIKAARAYDQIVANREGKLAETVESARRIIAKLG